MYINFKFLLKTNFTCYHNLKKLSKSTEENEFFSENFLDNFFVFYNFKIYKYACILCGKKN